MSHAYVESVSESLVREYLKRKSLHETLQMMGEECPRKPGSISNRNELAKSLKIQHLVRKNKTREKPYKAMIEVIAKDLINPKPPRHADDANTGSHETAMASRENHKIAVAARESHKTAVAARGSHETSMSSKGSHETAMTSLESQTYDLANRGSHEPTVASGESYENAMASRGSHETAMANWESQQYDLANRGSHTTAVARRGSHETEISSRGSHEAAMASWGSQEYELANRGSHASEVPSRESYETATRAEWISENYDKGPGRYDDLVLEDSQGDGETYVGDGKAGVLNKATNDEPNLYPGAALPPGGTSKPPRLRGMAGPISSNLNERDKNRLIGRVRSGHTNGRMTSDASFSLDDAPIERNNSLVLTETQQNSLPPERKKSAHSRTNADLYNNLLITQNPSVNTHNAPVDALSQSVNNNNSKKSLEDVLSCDMNTSLESASTSRAQKRWQEKKQLDDYLCPISECGVSKEKVKQRVKTLSEAKDILNMLSGKKPKEKVDDLQDLDDLEDEVNGLDLGIYVPPKRPSFVVESYPIDIKTASELKTLILGSPQLNFNEEWRYQSFTFCDLPHLQYGIVQKKGGSCGILASVQACVLQDLLFRSGHKPTNKDLQPNRERRSDALATAIANILWRAGDGKSAIVTIPGMQAHFSNSSKLKTDRLIEMLMINVLTSKDNLQTFLQQNIRQFELDDGGGVILLLYSVLLSRTIAGVRQDMDEPSNKLMGAHCYCSQEMVNLILTGRAVSNVFNDVMELDGGTVLGGVQGRSDIGLLSLFEHYNSCQVGTYLKTPRYAIWVVCSESHFTVLFSLKRDLLCDWKAEKRFDLFYYDGLGRQDAEIRLTLDTTNRHFTPPEDELVPPLELCIRTKWPDAEIDWNGTEPLL